MQIFLRFLRFWFCFYLTVSMHCLVFRWWVGWSVGLLFCPSSRSIGLSDLYEVVTITFCPGPFKSTVRTNLVDDEIFFCIIFLGMVFLIDFDLGFDLGSAYILFYLNSKDISFGSYRKHSSWSWERLFINNKIVLISLRCNGVRNCF